MSFLQRYGTQHGIFPQTLGQVFYVSAAVSYSVAGQSCIADAANSGTSPDQAILTLSAAIAKCTANSGDVIVLLPGSHSWTGTTAVNVAGITITGVPRGSSGYRGRRNAGSKKQQSSITSTAGAVLTVSVADVEICYLNVVPFVGSAGILLSNAAADRTYIHDCTLTTVGTGDTNTMGISVNAAINDTIVSNCFFHNEGANGPGVLFGNAVTVDSLVENCTFYNGGDTAWDDAIKTIAVSIGNVFRDIDFVLRASAVAITDGLDIASSTTDGSSTVLRCYFAVGCGINNNNVADNQCAESYTMQAAASVGGTLILST